MKQRRPDKKEQVNTHSVPIHSASTLHPLNILHQILNRTYLDPPLLSKPQASIPSHHPIVTPNFWNSRYDLSILHKFRDDTRLRLARQPTELHCRLCMSRACPDTSGSGL